MVEYPAIKYACDTAIEMNEPVLYLHTKGAANPKTWIQIPTRKIWKQEFGDLDRAKKLFQIANTDKPLVVCPFSGKGRETWFNGFIINPNAAKILIKSLKKPNECERHYYERMFTKLPSVGIFCSIHNQCNSIRDMLSFLSQYKKKFK